ncbi:MAG: hypothetical protein SCM96_03805 [Acidobacteriota bacterium]|nr:hypothetical protein [Acidobacteriota bacterium]
MRCATARKQISEYGGVRANERKAGRLDAHLATCSECREILKDFQAIAAGASRLETPDPPERVWLRIRSELEKSAVSEPAVRSVRAEAPRRSFRSLGPAWRFAAAAALLLVAVGGGIFLGVRMGRQSVPVLAENGERTALAKLDEAERYYILAIQSLSEAFADERENLPVEIAEIFEKNFEVFDATIQVCREAVLMAPEDIQARAFLLSAYREKMAFMDDALSFQDASWVTTSGPARDTL